MTATLTSLRQARLEYDLTNKEISDYLGLGKEGQKTVRDWEINAGSVPKNLEKKILALSKKPPFSQIDSENKNYKFKFIDLFAGVGGIRLPFQKLNGKCVFSSEWDKFSQKTYKVNFGEVPAGDITKIPVSEIPNHDVLLAGFPCQPFSQAGLRKGFEDPRGTLFFDILRILAHKKPKAFLLENVKQLRGHDEGRTLKTILDTLGGKYQFKPSNFKKMNIKSEAYKTLSSKLNYHLDYTVLSAKDFGVPQKRERIYIVGFDKNQFPKGFDFTESFSFPKPKKTKTCLGNILEDNSSLNPKYTLSERLWEGHQKRRKTNKIKGNGFGYCMFDNESPYANTLSARYYKDGSEILIDQSNINKRPRKLTPRECAKLQGFPNNFIIPVSDCQAYKQFGNSVSVPVIKAIARNMMRVLNS